ncbi:SRPBCC family protein [Desulfoferrobacter suflitae]|uniref:SRPBCC family protein n=1 Tax=Desulfoferrobacter suflitae TaxID=2865782 RepID=UPI002164D0DF|nr:SRPBCC family protein [Desulfoferrobacter suflitae]MCK8602616.1 SRPBCC family protein [Desulfoferrobacter suflitae]
MERRFVEVVRKISASPEAVWEITTDTWRWPEWGPSIVHVQCSERYIKAGSAGRVKTIFGLWLPFVITDFEHGRRWSWLVAGIQATGHRVEPIGVHRCRLVFEVPRLAFPYVVICQLAERRIAGILEKQE